MLCNILIHKHGLAAGFETKLISRICKIFYLLLAGLACSGVPVLSNPKFIHSSQYETPCMPLLYISSYYRDSYIKCFATFITAKRFLVFGGVIVLLVLINGMSSKMNS